MAMQVYTASLLREGLVAYLCLENGISSWTSDIRQATADSEGQLDLLKTAAEQAERENIVVAPYAIDVLETENGWKAATKREQIRAEGPTIVLPKDSGAVRNSDENLQAA